MACAMSPGLSLCENLDQYIGKPANLPSLQPYLDLADIKIEPMDFSLPEPWPEPSFEPGLNIYPPVFEPETVKPPDFYQSFPQETFPNSSFCDKFPNTAIYPSQFASDNHLNPFPGQFWEDFHYDFPSISNCSTPRTPVGRMQFEGSFLYSTPSSFSSDSCSSEFVQRDFCPENLSQARTFRPISFGDSSLSGPYQFNTDPSFNPSISCPYSATACACSPVKAQDSLIRPLEVEIPPLSVSDPFLYQMQVQGRRPVLGQIQNTLPFSPNPYERLPSIEALKPKPYPSFSQPYLQHCPQTNVIGNPNGNPHTLPQPQHQFRNVQREFPQKFHDPMEVKGYFNTPTGGIRGYNIPQPAREHCYGPKPNRETCSKPQYTFATLPVLVPKPNVVEKKAPVEELKPLPENGKPGLKRKSRSFIVGSNGRLRSPNRQQLLQRRRSFQQALSNVKLGRRKFTPDNSGPCNRKSRVQEAEDRRLFDLSPYKYTQLGAYKATIKPGPPNTRVVETKSQPEGRFLSEPLESGDCFLNLADFVSIPRQGQEALNTPELKVTQEPPSKIQRLKSRPLIFKRKSATKPPNKSALDGLLAPVVSEGIKESYSLQKAFSAICDDESLGSSGSEGGNSGSSSKDESGCEIRIRRLSARMGAIAAQISSTCSTSNNEARLLDTPSPCGFTGDLLEDKLGPLNLTPSPLKRALETVRQRINSQPREPHSQVQVQDTRVKTQLPHSSRKAVHDLDFQSGANRRLDKSLFSPNESSSDGSDYFGRRTLCSYLGPGGDRNDKAGVSEAGIGPLGLRFGEDSVSVPKRETESGAGVFSLFGDGVLPPGEMEGVGEGSFDPLGTPSKYLGTIDKSLFRNTSYGALLDNGDSTLSSKPIKHLNPVTSKKPLSPDKTPFKVNNAFINWACGGYFMQQKIVDLAKTFLAANIKS